MAKKPKRKRPRIVPHGTIEIKFEEEPSDDDWFCLMRFLRASTVFDGDDSKNAAHPGGYDITIIPREHREEAQREADLERLPVFYLLAGGIIPLFWDAEGHVMDNETANMPEEGDDD